MALKWNEVQSGSWATIGNGLIRMDVLAIGNCYAVIVCGRPIDNRESLADAKALAEQQARAIVEKCYGELA